ncbi:hypothetical protein Q5752_002829 [Cryptotrichosporon argae]
MFGSTWGQNNQQQQQPQQTGGLFGGAANSGFGQTAGGFGQQQQPATGFGQQANTGGNMFGSNTATTNTGFGFGQSNPQQQNNAFGAARPGFGATGNSVFGSSAPATNTTGGGLFGNTTTTFGATNNGASGGLFGAKPATTGFGAGTGATGGLFGSQQPASGGMFGAAATGGTFGQTQQQAPPGQSVPQSGTLQPPYEAPWAVDPGSVNVAGKDQVKHRFHVITAMPPYAGASLEELRLMDYINGNKQPPPGATFGAPAAGTTGFGSTSTFGQQQPAAGGFGQQTGTGLFGSTNTAGGFGQQQQQTASPFGQPQQQTGGLFGQPQQTQASPFGQTNTAPTGGLFGQAQNTSTGGGLFGGAAATASPFGQTNQQQPPASTGFTFGGAAKPFGQTTSTFGQQQPAATTTFGQPQQPAATNTFGTFGQPPPQQQQPAAGGGLFGNTTPFGATNTQQQQQPAAGGLFGQQNQQQPATGGLFGSTAPKPAGGLFGSTPAATTTTSTFGFGQNNAATSQPASGLFGQTQNTTQPASGLFGSTQQQPAQQPAQTGGLFGNTTANTGTSLFGAPKPAAPASGGLFGQPAQPAQPAQAGSTFGFGATNTATTGGGLFGATQNQQAKPGGGLFGSTTTGTGTGLFGQSAAQPAAAAPAGGSLFGGFNQSQPQTGSLFGSTAAQPAQSTGLFGSTLGQSTLAQPQPQANLTASVDQNPYGQNQLFAYAGQKLDLSTTVKKPALPPLTASSYRITPQKGRITKLRGFASPGLGTSQQSPARTGSPVLTGTPGRGLSSSPAPDRYKGLTDAALSPNAFLPRPSVKKLSVAPRASAANGSDDPLESVLGKSALRSSSAAPTPERSPLPVTNGGNGKSPASTVDAIDTPTRRPVALTDSVRVAGSDKPIKHGEYWCRPKLDKLRQIGFEDLAHIENFSAGRKGFGEVTFLEPVDLTGLNNLSELLGGIIQVQELELAVYPEDTNKPPRGKGLNVPAQISLENCFARDKATRQPVTDPSDHRFQRQLKRVKAVPDTEFVSFTDDGTWTFRVEHFSRYGLASDDEDSDEAAAGPVGKHREHREQRGASASPSYASEESDSDFLPPTKSIHDHKLDDHDSGLDGVDDDMSDSDGASINEHDETSFEADDASPERAFAAPAPLATRLGADGLKKIREMQSGLFDRPQPQPALKRGLVTPAHARKAALVRMAEPGFGEAEEDDVALGRATKRASFGQVQSPPQPRQPRKYAKVALAKSVESGAEGVRADAGLALGRSFRCSWGPNGELVHFGKICSPATSFASGPESNVFIERVELLADADAEKARAERLLRLHLDRTRIDAIDGVPVASLDPSIRFHDFAAAFDTGDRSHEASVFRLGQTLFDEVDLALPADAPDELRARVAEVRRKLALTRWLEAAVAPAVDTDLVGANDGAAKVFALLSGNQVDRAVQAALNTGDLRLATLVAQAGGPEVFRSEVKRQIDDWNKYKTAGMIAPTYRKVYAVLAGITDVSPGNDGKGSDAADDVLIAQGLDWKRAFGLRLWYGSPFEDTIADVLESYTAALDSSTPPARPIPPYLETPADGKTWNLPETHDVLFHLIRLYADLTVPLDDAVDARATSRSPTDLRLPWHLALLLSRVLAKRDFSDRDDAGHSAAADTITLGYAAQLEQAGQWTWAAFVLCHLELEGSREVALRGLVGRHADDDGVDFIVDTLKVPVEWVHEAKAAQLSSHGDAYKEFFQLIKAGLYDKAHRVLLDKLAPEAVLRDDRALLRRLCEQLECKPDRWEFGGKLLLDYLDLVERAQPLLEAVLRAGAHPDPHDAAELVSLAHTLPRVIQLLPALFGGRADVQQVAGLSEALAALHALAGVLHMAGYAARPHVTDLLAERDRLHLLQSAAGETFERSLAALTA